MRGGVRRYTLLLPVSSQWTLGAISINVTGFQT
jgi:hypothetical protein